MVGAERIIWTEVFTVLFVKSIARKEMNVGWMLIGSVQTGKEGEVEMKELEELLDSLRNSILVVTVHSYAFEL